MVSVMAIHAQWVPIDSLAKTVRVPAGSSYYCTVNQASSLIFSDFSLSTEKLTTKAQEALAYAPQWLRITLEDKFSLLSASHQDSCAQIILDAKDPYVDEISFTIAHLPLEVIVSSSFYPEIIRENAVGIYRADSGLDYVAIIDSGSAAQGGNYFSTTQYRVLENGVETQHTLPRDTYYWFVVHPKLQGELPTYSGTTSPEPTPPPKGKFWRTYLWDHKEAGYGALCDTLKGVTFLWANKINNPAQNGALGRLSQWCNTVMPWGGGFPDYRWPYPVYLYHQHRGTCSEHGWFASAAGRTALIPVTLCKAPRYDHKWNEFFDTRWIDWEPINGWINRLDEPAHANDYWADPAKPPLNGCFNWRGDGFIWGTTERYSAVCTLSVTVTDARGDPVDGARITIDAEGVGGNFLLAGWTGSDGYCQFLLGDGVQYFTGAVSSARGSVSPATVISNSVAGKKYTWSPKVTGAGNELVMKHAPLLASTKPSSLRLVYSVDARQEYVYGKHGYALFDYSFPCTFSDERSTGSVDFFICNEENFKKYQKNESFEAVTVKKGVRVIDSIFTIPNTRDTWYLVASGDEKSVVTTLVSLSLKLLQQDGSAVQPRPDGSVTHTPALSLSCNRGFIHAAFFLSAHEYVSLQLYTAAGTVVSTLFDGRTESGLFTLSYPVNNIVPGIYFCRLLSATLCSTAKIIITR